MHVPGALVLEKQFCILQATWALFAAKSACVFPFNFPQSEVSFLQQKLNSPKTVSCFFLLK